MLGALGLVVMISGAQFLKQDVQGSEQLDRSNNKTNTSQIRSEGFSFIEAIATKQFWMIFAMVFCFGFCVFVIQVHIVPYTTDMQISAATAALILSTIGGSSIIGRIVLGSLGDKIGNRNAYIIVFLPMAISILLLIPSREPWNFFLLAFIFGLAYGNGVAQESPLVAAMFGLSSLGSILGLIVFAFGIGVAIGPVLASYMFDVTGSYQLALIVTAAVSVIALILTILLKPVKAKIQAN